jgi:hypothetical protein
MIFDLGWLGRARALRFAEFRLFGSQNDYKMPVFQQNDYTAFAHRFDYSARKTITKPLFSKKTITFHP